MILKRKIIHRVNSKKLPFISVYLVLMQTHPDTFENKDVRNKKLVIYNVLFVWSELTKEKEFKLIRTKYMIKIILFKKK